MKENGKKEKRKEEEHFIGKMVENMKEIGKIM